MLRRPRPHVHRRPRARSRDPARPLRARARHRLSVQVVRSRAPRPAALRRRGRVRGRRGRARRPRVRRLGLLHVRAGEDDAPPEPSRQRARDVGAVPDLPQPDVRRPVGLRGGARAPREHAVDPRDAAPRLARAEAPRDRPRGGLPRAEVRGRVPGLQGAHAPLALGLPRGAAQAARRPLTIGRRAASTAGTIAEKTPTTSATPAASATTSGKTLIPAAKGDIRVSMSAPLRRENVPTKSRNPRPPPRAARARLSPRMRPTIRVREKPSVLRTATSTTRSRTFSATVFAATTTTTATMIAPSDVRRSWTFPRSATKPSVKAFSLSVFVGFGEFSKKSSICLGRRSAQAASAQRVHTVETVPRKGGQASSRHARWKK